MKHIGRVLVDRRKLHACLILHRNRKRTIVNLLRKSDSAPDSSMKSMTIDRKINFHNRSIVNGLAYLAIALRAPRR